MSYIARSSLFEKLNSICYQTAEYATAFCKMRHHSEVEMAHWLHQLLQQDDSDIQSVIRHFPLSEARIAQDLHNYLEALPKSASSGLDFSWVMDQSIERAWVLSSLLFQESQIRSGHLLAAMLEDKQLNLQLNAISNEFQKLTWRHQHEEIVSHLQQTPEAKTLQLDAIAHQATAQHNATSTAKSNTHEQALTQYTVDMTEQARQGEIDNIIGRDHEIRQVIDILLRRRQNNPLLTGEAGVGKTAIIEGLAHKIVKGDVPPKLKNGRILLLDMGLLQAGASMKGQFEERLKQIIQAIEKSTQYSILFIDEAHTLIGAGGQAGTSDAANLLKPPLARGTLRTIAATTWSEYKQHIEKDPALTRRFQVVQVPEPEPAQAIAMLRHIAHTMATHHGVLILDEALQAAVHLSSRYIPARQLPDKAVSLIDTACARISLSQHSTPAKIDDLEKSIAIIETQMASLTQEGLLGFDNNEQQQKLFTEKAQQQAEVETLHQQWQQEKAIIAEILETRQQLLNLGEDSAQQDSLRTSLQTQLQAQHHKLAQWQQSQPLILPEVDEQAIAQIIQDWTGIPVNKMNADLLSTTLNLDSLLSEQVIGQDEALSAIGMRIKTAKAKLEDPNKPIGVFLLAGPSGVGKTQTAYALANTLYGGEHNLITINMSEFQEAHTVSTLKGAPPGYVGYGSGGVLTEAVRRKPYSVLLLDEIEKAHADVHELFFQVFDKGIMEDGEGRSINFRNNLILLTTNIGTELMQQYDPNSDTPPDYATLIHQLHNELLKVFPAALLGRMTLLPYKPLQLEHMQGIVTLHLDKIVKRLQQQEVQLTYDEHAIQHIITLSDNAHSGARMIEHCLSQYILPTISHHLLSSQLHKQRIQEIKLSANETGFSYHFEGSEQATAPPSQEAEKQHYEYEYE